MSCGLGRRQRVFLGALRDLEAEHGAQWVDVHAAVRAVWLGQSIQSEKLPAKDWRGTRQFRQTLDAETALNPSRVLAGLARRGLIERNSKRGLGASVRLTGPGRRRITLSPD
jgi:hypothetical protein